MLHYCLLLPVNVSASHQSTCCQDDFIVPGPHSSIPQAPMRLLILKQLFENPSHILNWIQIRGLRRPIQTVDVALNLCFVAEAPIFACILSNGMTTTILHHHLEMHFWGVDHSLQVLPSYSYSMESIEQGKYILYCLISRRLDWCAVTFVLQYHTKCIVFGSYVTVAPTNCS